MGRPHRMFADGVYHVASHGSDDRRLFIDNADRREFLSRLGLTFWKQEIELIAYVLMGNHYHSQAPPTARASLPRALLRAAHR